MILVSKTFTSLRLALDFVNNHIKEVQDRHFEQILPAPSGGYDVLYWVVKP